MHKRSILILAVVLVLVLVVILRFSGKNAKAGVSSASSLRTVAVALVKRTPISNSLTLSGAFRPYQEVDVHAKVAGYIRHIYVDVGDKVKEGQTLAILEVPELNAQVAGANADIRRRMQFVAPRASLRERNRLTPPTMPHTRG